MRSLRMRAARICRSKEPLAKRRLLGEMLEARQVLTTLLPGFTETLITTGSDLTAPTAMEIGRTGRRSPTIPRLSLSSRCSRRQ